MSSMTIDNKTRSLLAAANKDFVAAQANTGEGQQGEWPPEGDHDCWLLGIHLKESKFKESGAGGLEHPCAEVHFEFQVIPSPKDPTSGTGEGLIFRGGRMQVVAQSALQQEGSKTRGRMDLERLKGHLSRVLDCQPQDITDIGDALTRAQAKVAETKMAFRVRCQYRASKTSTAVYKTDFLVDNITG